MYQYTHLLDEMILALVAEDDVDLLRAGAADVGPEHHVVGRVAVHVRLVQLAVEELDVPAAAIDVLLVLHCELDHQGLVPAPKKNIFSIYFTDKLMRFDFVHGPSSFPYLIIICQLFPENLRRYSPLRGTSPVSLTPVVNGNGQSV
jgi:hypothetical protein